MNADMKDPELLTCTCCGGGVYDTPDQNVSYGEVPSPHDIGYGLCVECGGDRKIAAEKRVRNMTGSEIKKRLGWAACTFFEARFGILQKRLSPKNGARFSALSYAKKVAIVARLVERGVMI